MAARAWSAHRSHSAARTFPYPLDRNAIERWFCRPENWRNVATRCERPARKDLASFALVIVVGECTGKKIPD